METMDKLLSTTLQSKPLTHFRLKHLAAIAQTSEDHISRLGLGLSMAAGPINPEWQPSVFNSEKSLAIEINEKQIRGKTLFKGDLAIWMTLTLRHQIPENYDEWRQAMRSHWERGVEILMERTVKEGDWLRTNRACVPD